MKKKYMLMLFVLLFSFVAETMPVLVKAQAETTKVELINEKFLKVSYDCESQKDSNRWRITFNRQSEDNDKKQLLKLKVMNDNEKVITYPSVEDMTEKDEWLIEKKYSPSMEGQLVFELPKSVKELNLKVQMDEQTLSENGEAVTQENILDGKNSFVLKTEEVKDSAKKETKSSESNPTVKTSSSQIAGPQLNKIASVPAIPAIGVNQFGTLSYSNKTPEYTDESNGSKYPTHPWTPTGQTNVINHQGGYENETGWDGLTEWDVDGPNNQVNSYIYYGPDKSDPNIAIRKYASQTSDENQFNIRLNVRGNTVAKPGVDVCIVLDNSLSMRDTVTGGSGTSRKDLVKTSLTKLISDLKKLNTAAGVMRVGSVIFATPSILPDDKSQNTPLSENKKDWDTIETKYNVTFKEPNGNTYTQEALMDAQKMLEDASGTNRRKVIFLLTDGAPNYSAIPTAADSDSNIFYDGLHITRNEEDSITLGRPMQDRQNSNGTPVYTTMIKSGWQLAETRQTLRSHLTPVNSTAADIKAEGIEINTVAINIKNAYSSSVTEHSTTELIKGLYRVASKKNGTSGTNEKDYQFYHATTSGGIGISFDDWFDSIVETVNMGTIDDPIGDMFDLVEGPKVTEIKKNGVNLIDSDKFPVVDKSDNRKVQVNNINLYGKQEIQIDYTVRLKTDDRDYRGGIWYPTNGKTTLTPTSERSDETMEFGSPSARGKITKVQIPVEKIWSDTQKETKDYWGLRASSVNAVLQRKNGNSWDPVATKSLSATKSWKDVFDAVEVGSVYRVVEEPQTLGYAKPIYNYSDEFTIETLPVEGIKITNNLLTGDASFLKYKNDGRTPFSEDVPEFSVKQKSSNKVLATNLKPDASGQVKIPDIPMGEFIVEETSVPIGYAKMANIELKAVPNSNGDGLDITLDGKTSPIQVTNKLNDFTLTVNKEDQDGEDLVGATFRLIGTSYDKTLSEGSSFVFNGLRPGEYILTETEAPNGYKKMDPPLRISISEDGKVDIPEHPSASGSGSVGKDQNKIMLTVKNERRPGTLPRTGGAGTKTFFKVAFGTIASAGGLLAIYYCLDIRKRRP